MANLSALCPPALCSQSCPDARLSQQRSAGVCLFISTRAATGHPTPIREQEVKGLIGKGRYPWCGQQILAWVRGAVVQEHQRMDPEQAWLHIVAMKASAPGTLHFCPALSPLICYVTRRKALPVCGPCFIISGDTDSPLNTWYH